MAERQEVTIENRHRYAVHIIGRRFRPGRPRTLLLNERQLKTVRGNPWLWIEGEDFEASEGDEESYADHTVAELKDILRSMDLPVSGNKEDLIARLEEAKTQGDEEEQE